VGKRAKEGKKGGDAAVGVTNVGKDPNKESVQDRDELKNSKKRKTWGNEKR